MKNALILGSSSGFGKATVMELAKKGYNIYGVHLDLGSARIKAEEFIEEISSMGIKVKFFNTNAANPQNRNHVIEAISNELKDLNGKINVFMHSIAFGALGNFIDKSRDAEITAQKMEMSINVMALSLLYWVQDLFHADLFKENSRIFAMTSNGSNMATNNYGAISVAKAALESIVRQIAFELAPFKITANAILAGPTPTPSGLKIPGFERMIKFAKEFSPFNRLTTPEDAARMIGLLSSEEASWITGQVIRVDGGQSLFTNLYDGY